ncbi:MAG: oxygenase MpaB family protein [Solirubrobacterales bacterium]
MEARPTPEAGKPPLRAVDHGYFGPGSATWKVHSHPIILVGGFRALMIQALHPLAMAGVTHFSDFREDPLKRLRRTAGFVHTVVFADTQTVDKLAARVRSIHDRVSGIDPVTGREYSAADPETLLWVHCAEAHSFLYSYRVFAGDLTEDEQDQYLTEYVRAGELVGIPRQDIPRTRAEYRDYFREMQPKLCSSEMARETVDFVARPRLRYVPPKERPFALNLKFAGHSAVTLMPRSLREMAGLKQPGAREWTLTQLTKANARVLELALRSERVADRFDRIAQQKLGTGRTPSLHTGG